MRFVMDIFKTTIKFAIALALAGQLKNATIFMMKKAAHAQMHGQVRLSDLNRALMGPRKSKRLINK